MAEGPTAQKKDALEWLPVDHETFHPGEERA